MLESSWIRKVSVLNVELVMGYVVHLEDKQPQGILRIVLVVKRSLLLKVRDCKFGLCVFGRLVYRIGEELPEKLSQSYCSVIS